MINPPEDRPLELNEATRQNLLNLSDMLLKEVSSPDGEKKFNVSENRVMMFKTLIESGMLPVSTREIDGGRAFAIDKANPDKLPTLVVDRNQIIDLSPEDPEKIKALLHELSHYIHSTGQHLTNLVMQANNPENN